VVPFGQDFIFVVLLVLLVRGDEELTVLSGKRKELCVECVVRDQVIPLLTKHKTHNKHTTNTSVHRLAGWWGNDPNTRFEMRRTFVPVPTADAWQLSNAPVLGMAALSASITIFDSLEFSALRDKSLRLSQYLMSLIDNLQLPGIEVLTPSDSQHRGCQVSVRVCAGTDTMLAVFKRLEQQGILADKRMPDVIRLSPVPLYNSFLDVYKTAHALKLALDLLTPIPISQIVEIKKFQ